MPFPSYCSFASTTHSGPKKYARGLLENIGLQTCVANVAFLNICTMHFLTSRIRIVASQFLQVILRLGTYSRAPELDGTIWRVLILPAQTIAPRKAHERVASKQHVLLM